MTEMLQQQEDCGWGEDESRRDYQRACVFVTKMLGEEEGRWKAKEWVRGALGLRNDECTFFVSLNRLSCCMPLWFATHAFISICGAFD
eukprot:474856-Ditylum_brightwellii.AAC.2